LTSIPRVSTSRRAKRVWAWAVRKARTTPEPGPISRRSGVGESSEFLIWGEEVEKRVARKAVSEEEESVSRRRKESSAGS
jgi:hypothetical protein